MIGQGRRISWREDKLVPIADGIIARGGKAKVAQILQQARGRASIGGEDQFQAVGPCFRVGICRNGGARGTACEAPGTTDGQFEIGVFQVIGADPSVRAQHQTDVIDIHLSELTVGTLQRLIHVEVKLGAIGAVRNSRCAEELPARAVVPVAYPRVILGGIDQLQCGSTIGRAASMTMGLGLHILPDR